MFFYFSLFGATRFRGQLGLKHDYILNNYGNKVTYEVVNGSFERD